MGITVNQKPSFTLNKCPQSLPLPYKDYFNPSIVLTILDTDINQRNILIYCYLPSNLHEFKSLITFSTN